MSEGLEQYMDEANLESLGANDDSGIEESTTVDQAETQSEETETSTEETQELSLEEQLNQLEAPEEGKEVEGQAFLDHVNGLGATRNGLPVEIESMDQLKEYLQKGADYTFKSQERESEYKAREEEYAQREESLVQKEQETESFLQENQSELTANQIMGDILSELQHNDPDTFAEIQGEFQKRINAHGQNLNNPVVNELKGKVSELESKLNGQGKEQESKQLDAIREEWDKGLSEVQKEFGVKLRSLGIKPDWKAVQNDWTSDATNSKTVKEAFFAKHGEQIAKALTAEKKLAQTKQKSAQRMGTGTFDAGKSSEEKAPVKSGHGIGSYMDDLERIAQKHA